LPWLALFFAILPSSFWTNLLPRSTPVSESSVANALSGAFAGRTVILITHRMSLAEKADKIVVLENGRIVEEGPPRKLISSQGEMAHHFQVVQSPIPEIV